MPEPAKSGTSPLGNLRRILQGGGLASRVLRGGAASGLVQGFNKLLALALGIFLARFLGAEGYGIYAHAMAMLTLLVVIAGLGFPSLLLREIAAGLVRQEWEWMRGIIRRGRQTALLLASVLSVCGLALVWWKSGSMPAEQYQVLALMLVLLPFAALNKNQLFVLRGLDRVTLSLIAELLLQPLVVLSVVAIFFLGSAQMRRPEIAILGQFAAVLISILSVTLMINRAQPVEMKQAATKFKTRQWLKSAIPFTLIGGAGIINSQTDILMLGWLRSAEEVGIYRVAVQGATLVAFGLVALNAVIAPQFARLHAQNDMFRLQRLVTLSARVILLCAVPFVLVFVLAGGKVAAWVFGAEFESSHFPLAILALAQLVNASMGSVGFLLNMTGHEKDSANVLMLTAFLNVILNAILIPEYGFEGAAVATGLSIVLWKVMMAILVKKRLGLNSTAFARLEVQAA